MSKNNPKQPRYTLEELQGKAPSTAMVILATVGLLTIALGTLLPIFGVKLGPL